MSATTWTEQDTQRARHFWVEYQKVHDVSGYLGEAVGIDPNSGEVFFGASALDIAADLESRGVARPLYFLRVGKDYYQRKTGRR